MIENFELAKYVDIINRIKIVNRPLFRDDKDVPAIFSRYLRLVYGFKNQKEYLITDIYNELIAEVEKSRRTRSFINKEKIELIIGKNLVKDTLFEKIQFLIGYEKIENGYKKKTDIDEELIDLKKVIEWQLKKFLKVGEKHIEKSSLLVCYMELRIALNVDIQ